jgi:dienelactone hydrolase
VTSGPLRHLGAYSDLVAAAGRAAPLFRERALDAAQVRALLGFGLPEAPLEVRGEGGWSSTGVDGERLSWSVGYGPRTEAWLLRPAGSREPLPGVLALHGHDGFRLLGKEKIADGPEGAAPAVADLRRLLYEGRAFANDLARHGFAVLVHDVFLWGSRRFDPSSFPDPTRPEPESLWIAPGEPPGDLDEPAAYNRAALAHEHLIAKYLMLLGASLAAVVAYEDRVAAAYLRSREDVTAPLGAVGLSGGGCRTALLQATVVDVGAAVIAGMMSTHAALLDRHVAPHTWMFFPPGLAGRGDWPDLAAARAPSPLLVQYLEDDELFPPDGMRAADRRLRGRYAAAGRPDAYAGRLHPGRHRFDRHMQEEAFGFLERLRPGASAAG